MAVQFRRQKGMGDEISTASMSDIAFLLLIFFLVTTIFNQEQGLPMQLPGQASETAKINRKNILDIDVEANNLVYLDGVQFQVPSIENEVRRRVLSNPKLIIQLKIHPAAFYGTMVNVLDELHLAEATKISIKGMEVVKKIEAASSAGDATRRVYDGIKDEIVEVSHSLQEIGTGMRELNEGSRQILEAMNQLRTLSTDVSDAIIKASHDYDLIIIGASNEWRLRQRLFGSLPDKVANNASASVLMVRSKS